MIIRQEINIVNTSNASSSSSATEIVGPTIQLDTTQYNGTVTYYFEIVMTGAASNTGTIKLSRKGTATYDASITGTTSASKTRLRSVAFTPPANQTAYSVTLISDGTRTQTVFAARIIIIQNTGIGSPLLTTETQIEIGNDERGKTNTAAAALASPKYWTYIAANWNGTKTFYAEVCWITSSTNTATIKLQEDDGVFGVWSDKVTIVNAASQVTAGRTRSIAFAPTDGRHYRITGLTSTTKSTYSIYNAKVIADQAEGGIIADLNNTFGLGSSAAANGYAQPFSLVNDATVTGITIGSGKSGSPSDNLLVDIVTAPGGSSLGTASIAGSSITVGLTALLYTLTFSNLINLSAGVTYYIQITRSGAVDASNFYWLPQSSTSTSPYANAQILASGVWSALARKMYFCLILAPGGLTLFEPQYLLLNTKSTATGLLGFQTLVDPGEWQGFGDMTLQHAQDAIGATANAKLQDIDNSNTDKAGTSVIGANQVIGANLSMPSVAHQLDTNIVVAGTEVDASRLLVILRKQSVIFNNYLFLSVGDGMSMGDKIR